MAIHFFVNFGIFKRPYLAYYWVYLHQTFNVRNLANNAIWKSRVYMCKSVSFVCNGAVKNVMILDAAECGNPRN